MKTVGYIFDTVTLRLDGLIREQWVGVYFCDLKEPERFTTIERAVEYAYDQYLHLLPVPPDY